MKVKIKGLVFVGFAAAILSANAMAAGENTVTSKAYTDHTYQVKQTADVYKVGKNGGWTDASGAVNVADGGYLAKTPEDDGSVTLNVADAKIQDTGVTSGAISLTTGSEKLVTEGAVADALATLSTTSGNAYQPKTEANSGYKIGNSAGTWAAPADVVKEAGYIDITADSSQDGSILVNIDASQIANTQALVAAGDTKLTTGAGVKAYAQTLDEGTKYRVTKAGVWSDVGDAVGVASNSYLNRTVDSGTGALTIDANATANGSGISSALNTSKNLATDYAVKEYVQSVVNGITLPGMDTTVCGATAPCALVAESTGLHWRTMATADHPGGTCGDATGNCGASNNNNNNQNTEPEEPGQGGN